MGPSTGLARTFVVAVACLVIGLIAFLFGRQREAIAIGAIGVFWLSLRYLAVRLESRHLRQMANDKKDNGADKDTSSP
jgi:hypothetical protein